MTELSRQNLNHMGKAWFVLRYYSEHLDKSEQRFTCCEEHSLKFIREPRFNQTIADHAEYLVEVIATNPAHLGSNRLGITGKEVVALAKKCVLALI